MKKLLLVPALVSSFLVADLAAQSRDASGATVTPVAGESWLMHLGRSFDDSSMGKTGRLGPPAPGSGENAFPEESRSVPVMRPATYVLQTVTLRGADLYRLNCRGCHGESGLGAPPEINSVINPVRSSSAAAIMARMKATGMEISHADAAKLAAQSHALLLDRLHHGGQDMPAFPHLNEAEIHTLLAYLKLLAEVPGAEHEQATVRESSLRVGEHIVKSTCHTCHSAAGPNPDAQQLADGAIPPLSTLPSRVTEAQFIRKVTQGAPILMGAPAQLDRGRMPVFYYLTEEEAADVYLYLTQYPPYQWAVADQATASAPPASHLRTADFYLPPTPVTMSFAPQNEPAKVPPRAQDTDIKTAALISATVMFAALLLVAGLGFTVREMRRLSRENKIRSPSLRKNAATDPHTSAANRSLSSELVA